MALRDEAPAVREAAAAFLRKIGEPLPAPPEAQEGEPSSAFANLTVRPGMEALQTSRKRCTGQSIPDTVHGALLGTLLAFRFGPLTPEQHARLAKLPLDDIPRCFQRVLEAQSVSEVLET